MLDSQGERRQDKVMMQAVRGIYRSGVVELLEKPAGVAVAEVVVTFLPAEGAPDFRSEEDASDAVAFSEGAAPLDDFEPIAPARAVCLSDLVLEDRR
jgi:hypothetical protein